MSTATLETERTAATYQSAVDTGLLILRVVLGVTFMMHGSQKLFGALGGAGLAATVKMMGPLGYLVSIGEFFGGLGILVGVLTRFSALSIALIMLGAIGMVHHSNGFFMNWMGTQKGEGYEYHLLVIAICLALAVIGPGRYAVQNALPGLLRKL